MNLILISLELLTLMKCVIRQKPLDKSAKMTGWRVD
jgi:hypothetical protein